MMMSHGKTFITVVTLLGMAASLNCPTMVQAGTGGERCPTCIPVVGRLLQGTFIGELDIQGTFIGELDISNLAVDADGQLRASGSLGGRAIVNGVTTSTIGQEFADIGLALIQAGQSNVCDILILDFDLIHVDQLDSDLELSRITLNSTAPRSRGYRLGQLLCPLAGLLNDSPPNLAVILQLLDIINERL